MTEPREVTEFWSAAGRELWFRRDEAFDAEFRARFLDAHFAAARRECEAWLDDAEGALAVLLLLDQFPRNVFRGSGHSFATDGLARHYADRIIAARLDARIAPLLRAFVYLPFEHSEALADQDRAVALFTALGDAEYLRYAQAHRDVIATFGRFPHRNRVLGRVSTPDEQGWLDAGGGFGG